jgi:hypothetical protein
MGLLALALLNGLLRDIPAGMGVVVGTFYLILGVVFLRERVPALFGVTIATGALAIALLRLPFPVSTFYGVLVVGGGMVALGLLMLRHPEWGAPPAPPSGEDRPPELEQVRETLASLRGHEAAVSARDRSAKVFFAAALLALVGVAGFLAGTGPAPWAALGLAGLACALGMGLRGGAHAG